MPALVAAILEDGHSIRIIGNAADPGAGRPGIDVPGGRFPFGVRCPVCYTLRSVHGRGHASRGWRLARGAAVRVGG
jgi:hypothetical protein